MQARSLQNIAHKFSHDLCTQSPRLPLSSIANVDKAKVDAQNLTGVIVKIDNNRLLARVVVKSGLLKQWYSYHKLTCVVGKGNSIEL